MMWKEAVITYLTSYIKTEMGGKQSMLNGRSNLCMCRIGQDGPVPCKERRKMRDKFQVRP